MRQLTLLLLALLLTACGGGSKVVKEFEDPAYDGQMTKILLLLPNLFPQSNQYTREKIVEELESRGMAVAVRSDFFGASERLTREKLIAAIADSDVDGVLLVDLEGAMREDRGRASFADARGTYADFEDEIGYILSVGGNIAPVYRETQTDVFLRVRLFPESTKKLAWEQFLQFSNPGSVYDLVDKAAPVIAGKVAASGIVARN
ncbi:MAG: hypothetical protein AAGE01_16455 [Pseudomonadota bacterium]